MPLDSACSVNSRGWEGLCWDGADIAILASGESLSVEQCEAVCRWRDEAPDRFVIVINTTFRRALWADVLYACDGSWWNARERTDGATYGEEAQRTFSGQLWIQHTEKRADEEIAAAKRYGLHVIQSRPGRGLSREPGVVNDGSNSGMQAIGLAYQAGAARVYLLGYDMGGGHWHGRHPGLLDRNSRFDVFLKRLGELAADLPADFSVVNCTPGGALECFPRRHWREVFA